MKLSERIDEDPQSFIDRSADACGKEDCCLRTDMLVPEIKELERKAALWDEQQERMKQLLVSLEVVLNQIPEVKTK